MTALTPSHDFQAPLPARIDGTTKPLGALGRIEALAAQIARARGSPTPRTRAAPAEYRARPGHHLLVSHAGVIKAALATGPCAKDWPAALAFGEIVTI